MKKDTYIIGNKGFEVWIEKWKNPKIVNFKGRFGCVVKSKINIQTVPKEYSFRDAVVTIIPGINFPRCQNKIPFDFDKKDTSEKIESRDLYCKF